MGKLGDTKTQTDIIQRRAAGESYQSIADSYDVAKMSVYNFCKNHPDEIQRIHEELWADNIDTIVETIKVDLNNSKTISDNFAEEGNISAAEVAYKTSTNKVAAQLLQQKGIFPSSAFVQMTINNDNRKIENVDPEMFEMLTGKFNPGFVNMSEVPLIEAEVVGEKDES